MSKRVIAAAGLAAAALTFALGSASRQRKFRVAAAARLD